MFDNTETDSLELLRFYPSLTAIDGFEEALHERVRQVGRLPDHAFPLIVAVERLEGDGALALVSTHTPGKRLSAFVDRPGPRRGVNPSFVSGIVTQIIKALTVLQSKGEDVTHSAITADRIVVTTGGRVCVVEHVLGLALRQLNLSASQLWREFGLTSTPTPTAPFSSMRELTFSSSVYWRWSFCSDGGCHHWTSKIGCPTCLINGAKPQRAPALPAIGSGYGLNDRFSSGTGTTATRPMRFPTCVTCRQSRRLRHSTHCRWRMSSLSVDVHFNPPGRRLDRMPLWPIPFRLKTARWSIRRRRHGPRWHRESRQRLKLPSQQHGRGSRFQSTGHRHTHRLLPRPRKLLSHRTRRALPSDAKRRSRLHWSRPGSPQRSV
jgi:hypothetical protein